MTFYWMDKQTGELFTYPLATIEYGKKLLALEEILGADEAANYHHDFCKFFEITDIMVTP